ncbi:MAG: glycosyl transferase family 1 [Deltaproteobacteria bacterium CG_4_8_14_3_um_filter_51_11]|nr:glycosyltransferase family 4 protein [bacterium]OIP37622.1 MAG: glycosyl transferase family 1 [Desulfobacteraceae bacterium CG2_30_51_40]PIP48264.1 MAG: glycosyl transferase family 1 [Deltaproteobacteria bacterium CG23_combo_of_CG06-09_8_20_14_all_51_20]PIX20425.1 MAG: glycosyl transferase family 1 [Deltaproteobacteria bacterium CG_4_8_14_3_um_filter_51_11]PIY22307.1 MAG: glycosyl transferase family 1 [Deltaproteobacteria bacterium CG_4_10_14_3_um_filter_51_14]PJB33371.1 MAG: glycosyl trans
MRHSLALVHDFFSVKDGGGRLCLLLARAFKADVVHGFKTKDTYDPEAFAGIHTFDLNAATKIPGFKTAKLIRAFSRKTGFLRAYDTVIYSGELAPFAVQNHPEGRNIFYCHSPSRLAYDQGDFHLEQAAFIVRPAMRTIVAHLQKAYPELVSAMDAIIANSENVRRRIQLYWGKDSTVIYPPCDTKRFRWRDHEGYYLSPARLEPLKRVDLIVKAFLKMPDKRLIVVSGGSLFDSLRKTVKGASNIVFTGWVDDSRMEELIGGAIATIYIPMQEDFGMSPVESMAAGKPVVGVSEGGLLETVVHRETGILLPPNPSAEDIIDAVQYLDARKAAEMRDLCEQRAKRFDKEVFLREMGKLLQVR